MINEEQIDEMLQSGDCTTPLFSIENIFAIETVVARHLLDAIEALQQAGTKTNSGFVTDYCENAVQEIRKALRSCGT